MLKQLDLYAYFFQKRVHVEGALMKLKMSFWMKDDELLEKYNKIWGKVRNVSKKNLILNLYTMKNI